jgi:hypothetical protein
MEKNDLFDASLSAMLSPELHYNSTHGALYANQIDRPALIYACDGDERYLEASLNAWRKAKEKVILPNGGITCESEYLAPVGTVVETEYCAVTMYNKSLANLAMITGMPCFADDMEQTVYNCAEGARKKDERAIAYLTSPNQVMATASSSYANEGHQVYAPCVPVACCPVNSVRVLPEFLFRFPGANNGRHRVEQGQIGDRILFGRGRPTGTKKHTHHKEDNTISLHRFPSKNLFSHLRRHGNRCFRQDLQDPCADTTGQKAGNNSRYQ